MHSKKYFEEVIQVAKNLDIKLIEKLVKELIALRTRGGRLFLIGVGGSAANCSHADAETTFTLLFRFRHTLASRKINS